MGLFIFRAMVLSGGNLRLLLMRSLLMSTSDDSQAATRACSIIIILPASKNRILYNCSCGPIIINAGTGLAAGVAWG